MQIEDFTRIAPAFVGNFESYPSRMIHSGRIRQKFFDMLSAQAGIRKETMDHPRTGYHAFYYGEAEFTFYGVPIFVRCEGGDSSTEKWGKIHLVDSCSPIHRYEKCECGSDLVVGKPTVHPSDGKSPYKGSTTTDATCTKCGAKWRWL